jgi:hypothetical protein
MNRKTLRAVIIVQALSLAGCSALQAPATPDPDALATTVSSTLTAVPTRALPLEPTATESPASPTEAATETPDPDPTATATPTVQSTVTPISTPTIAATGTLPAEDVRSALGDPTWRDPLDSGINWPLGEDDFLRVEAELGVLRMTGLTTTDGWRLTWPLVQDFYLEMTVRTGTCSGGDQYGLMARVPDLSAADRGYLFGFRCDGRYSLRAWDGENMTTLVATTPGVTILGGSDQVNRIGLWAVGEQLGLYANGVLLTQIEDGTFTEEGAFGIFLGARQTEEFTISVDEIAYWADP